MWTVRISSTEANCQDGLESRYQEAPFRRLSLDWFPSEFTCAGPMFSAYEDLRRRVFAALSLNDKSCEAGLSTSTSEGVRVGAGGGWRNCGGAGVA